MKFVNACLTMFLMFGIACSSSKKETPVTTEAEPAAPALPAASLILKWESDSTMTTCESVLYNPHQDILYVSNINGKPNGKDGNGFISILGTDGTIQKEKWATGLDAPKGMGLSHGKLYVTDIDHVTEIDPETGNILNKYPVAGSSFLNDITVDANGKVYISDSGSGLIASLDSGKITVMLDSVPSPNGLFAEENRLMVGLQEEHTFSILDLNTQKFTAKVDSLMHPDGIEAVGNGAYLLSCWGGKVYYITSDWQKILLLDTEAAGINSADIEFIPEKKLLLVPTFFKNKVVAYELVTNH